MRRTSVALWAEVTCITAVYLWDWMSPVKTAHTPETMDTLTLLVLNVMTRTTTCRVSVCMSVCVCVYRSHGMWWSNTDRFTDEDGARTWQSGQYWFIVFPIIYSNKELVHLPCCLHLNIPRALTSGVVVKSDGYAKQMVLKYKPHPLSHLTNHWVRMLWCQSSLGLCS